MSGANLFHFLVSVLNFGLLLWACKFIVFDPLVKVAREREEQAARRMAEAEAVYAEAEALRREYRQRVERLEETRREIEAEARREAERIRRHLLDLGDSEARHLVDKARTEADIERRRALRGVLSGVAEASVSRARDLIRTSLDDDIRESILEGVLEKVGRTDAP